MRISDWSSDVCSSDLVLGERNEAAGRDIAERRVGPADQRLEAAQGAVLCGDDGLVIEFEFAAVERAAQFLLHHQSFFSLAVERRDIGGDAIAALVLRLAERKVVVAGTRPPRRAARRPPPPAPP